MKKARVAYLWQFEVRELAFFVNFTGAVGLSAGFGVGGKIGYELGWYVFLGYEGSLGDSGDTNFIIEGLPEWLMICRSIECVLVLGLGFEFDGVFLVAHL